MSVNQYLIKNHRRCSKRTISPFLMALTVESGFCLPIDISSSPKILKLIKFKKITSAIYWLGSGVFRKIYVMSLKKVFL